MTNKLWWFTLVYSLNEAVGLLCYNCSASHRERENCGGDFSPALQPFNNDRELLVNCSGDEAMCFVRSWSARSRYAWMVQRGCYQSSKGDPVPRAMIMPTRAMACRQERFAEAEYKVCFCQADWCNSISICRDKNIVHLVVILLIHVLSSAIKHSYF